MANGTWRSSGGGAAASGPETLIEYKEPLEPGATATSLTFSGLAGDTDGGYRLAARIQNDSASSRSYSMTINGAATNLGSFKVYSNGASVSAAAAAGVDIATLVAGARLSLEMRMRYSHKRKERYFTIEAIQTNGSGSTDFSLYIQGTLADRTNAISSIEIVGSGADAMGVGTEASLYEVAHA